MRPKITIITISIVVLMLMAFILPAFAYDSNIYFKMPVKKLLVEPKHEAREVYEIPVDVKLLGMSEDGNWYKVRIEFDLLFFGHYKYTGWVYAPLGEYLSQK